MARCALLALMAVPGTVAHFVMIKPSSWLDPDGKYGMKDGWRGAGCTGEKPPPGEENVIGCASQWYTNNTKIPGKPAFGADSDLVTYQKSCRGGAIGKVVCAGMAQNPWRAPGSAPVASPCGIDGGNPDGCPPGNPNGDGCQSGGYGHGPDARKVLKSNAHPAEWTAGDVVEVAFGITANHGGGYQYRLCPKPADHMSLTEECFQKTPLAFVGDTQWLQWDDNEANRTAIPAVRTAVGTTPAGSLWTRQPIPACGDFIGGGMSENSGKCKGFQFDPPIPGVYGFYGQTPNDKIVTPNGRRALTHWGIVDKVQVPSDLPAGDYVIGFRIDCEQTPQIWQQCGDVRISSA